MAILCPFPQSRATAARPPPGPARAGIPDRARCGNDLCWHVGLRLETLIHYHGTITGRAAPYGVAQRSPLLVTVIGFLYVGLATARDVPFFGELSMEPGPPTPVPPSRRRFLARLSIGLSSAIAAVVGVPVIGYLLSPLTRKAPRVWRPVGGVDQFEIGQTVNVAFEDASPLPWAGVTARSAAWLRRDDAEHFTAFTVHCTHLGCPVRWVATAQL